MFRRRPRRARDIPFGLDSFLDLVANVVGIIVRLILVAWVGARSYKALVDVPVPPPDLPLSTPEELTAPLKHELAKHRIDLQQTQERLLEQLRRVKELRADNDEAGRQVAALSVRRAELEQEQSALEVALRGRGQSVATVALSLEELRQRRQRLDEEVRALEKLPPARKVLRYRTPVSRPVRSDELHFECREGRVTFIDVASFVAEMRDALPDHAEELRSRWQVEGVTRPVGPFRVRYRVERQRGLLDSLGGSVPDADSSFRCGLSAWVVEPLEPRRGESVERAMAAGSAFRQIADRLDPEFAVVTFWVYEDSFPLFRTLRDYLYERGVEVAGRPLPMGHPIASSRRGTASRGQ